MPPWSQKEGLELPPPSTFAIAWLQKGFRQVVTEDETGLWKLFPAQRFCSRAGAQQCGSPVLLHREIQSARFSDQFWASHKTAVISSNRRRSKHQTYTASSSPARELPLSKKGMTVPFLATFSYAYEIPTTTAYPGATEASQAGCSAVITIINFHVVIPTVSLLLELKCLQYQLHPITIFSYNHPFTVCLTWVVVVPKLSMGIQLLSSYFCL